MRRTISVWVLLAACGGSPIVGVWRLTSNVTVQSPGGGTSMPRVIVTDFEITPTAWVVGGGCTAPLTFTGAGAYLTSPNMTCVLQSTTGLPFQDFIPYRAGDTLLIKTAAFEPSGQRLKIDFSMQIQNDPNRPDVGDVIELRTNPDGGAERIR